MEPIFRQLGVSLLLGMLVGLQRERSAPGTAGMRTFPLICLLGAASAILAQTFGGWVLAGGLAGIIAIIILGYVRRMHEPDFHTGTTTAVAMLVMFVVGALTTVEHLMTVAVALGGGTAVLLQFKPELHGLAKRLGDNDLRAIMQFVLITCIILPVLPNRTYGPFDVFNPFNTWLMVVLVVGMSLGGYIIYKFFGQDAGIFLGGVLGGSISSTATTVSFGRTAREFPLGAPAAAVVIMIASTVMYVRMLAAVAIVSPEFFRKAIVPILILMGLNLLPALAAWVVVHRRATHLGGVPLGDHENPTQLKSAIVFAVMYAAVLFALAAAQQFLGGHGLYAVAAISGLTEVDALTLSTARMAIDDPEVMAQGWRLLVIGALANLVSKAALAGILGGRALFKPVVILFLVPMLGGIGLLMLMH